MKKKHIKFVHFILLFFIVLTAAGQESTSFQPHKGVGQFVLGEDKAVYGTTIRFADSLTYKGETVYFYIHSFKEPYTIEGVSFMDAILTFDDKLNKLIQVELSKVYTKTLFSDYKNQSLRDYQVLRDFIKLQCKLKGRKKSLFNTLKADGYEWSKANVITWLYLQNSGSQAKTRQDHYSISIVFKYAEIQQ